MSKILSFCSLLGKIISIYFIMFLVSLMCVTFSPINKNNAKKRCTIEPNNYEYSFLENIKEIKSYNVYFSCNTIDIIINTEFNDIKEVAALSLKISKYLDKVKVINHLYTIILIIISFLIFNSTNTKEILDSLKNMFYEGNLAFNDEIYITNIRHKTALQDSLQSLLKVNDSIEMGMPEDFYSIDLLDAYESLGSITGETIGEDLVNEIFSKFCMGK